MMTVLEISFLKLLCPTFLWRIWDLQQLIQTFCLNSLWNDSFLEDRDENSSNEEDTQDAYFKVSDPATEHERFKAAEQRLEKKYKKKFDKVVHLCIYLLQTLEFHFSFS